MVCLLKFSDLSCLINEVINHYGAHP